MPSLFSAKKFVWCQNSAKHGRVSYSRHGAALLGRDISMPAGREREPAVGALALHKREQACLIRGFSV